MSYASIVIAAAAPASLYFLIVFVSVHLQARKDGIKALPRAELPKFRPVFVRGWYYMIPIAALVHFLVFKAYPPGMAGIYTCGFVVVVSFFSPDRSKWLIPSRIMNSFQDGVTRWITIAAIIASVGIMIGALELSGGGASRHRRVPDPVRLRVQPGAF